MKIVKCHAAVAIETHTKSAVAVDRRYERGA